MARSEILLGTAPSGVGGDTPRSANVKINAMTAEIYQTLGGLGSASRVAIQTNPKSSGNEALNSSMNGIGIFKDLRSSIYATGVPGDLWGSGFLVGFCGAGVLGVPSGVAGAGEYGVLTSNMQYGDMSGATGNMQEFAVAGTTLRRHPASAVAWTPWRVVGQITVGQVEGGSSSAIIEKGENGNGQWTKFADGTMIMRLAPKDTAFIPINTFAQTQLTSPQALITNDGVQTVYATAQPYQNNDHYGVISVSTGGGSLFNAIVRNGPAIGQSFKLNITVIGKWKF